MEGLVEEMKHAKYSDDKDCPKQESETKRSGKREICMSQERFLSDSLRRLGEGSPTFFVVLCGDVVRDLFARSVVVEMR